MVASVDADDVHTVCNIDPNEPENILSLLACDRTQVFPQSVRLNDVAARNMEDMSFTLDTSHFDRSPLKASANENISDMVVTLDTSHLERSPLNDIAPLNIPGMVVTLDTSQLEMSLLNAFAL